MFGRICVDGSQDMRRIEDIKVQALLAFEVHFRSRFTATLIYNSLEDMRSYVAMDQTPKTPIGKGISRHSTHRGVFSASQGRLLHRC